MDSCFANYYFAFFLSLTHNTRSYTDSRSLPHTNYSLHSSLEDPCTQQGPKGTEMPMAPFGDMASTLSMCNAKNSDSGRSTNLLASICYGHAQHHEPQHSRPSATKYSPDRCWPTYAPPRISHYVPRAWLPYCDQCFVERQLILRPTPKRFVVLYWGPVGFPVYCSRVGVKLPGTLGPRRRSQ